LDAARPYEGFQVKYFLTTDVSSDTVCGMDTKTVNLRDLPEDLVRRAKAYAALSGMTLKDFFVKAVETAMQQDIQPSPQNAGFIVTKARKKTKTS
jgi:hypothetical protein